MHTSELCENACQCLPTRPQYHRYIVEPARRGWRCGGEFAREGAPPSQGARLGIHTHDRAFNWENRAPSSLTGLGIIFSPHSWCTRAQRSLQPTVLAALARHTQVS